MLLTPYFVFCIYHSDLPISTFEMWEKSQQGMRGFPRTTFFIIQSFRLGTHNLARLARIKSHGSEEARFCKKKEHHTKNPTQLYKLFIGMSIVGTFLQCVVVTEKKYPFVHRRRRHHQHQRGLIIIIIVKCLLCIIAKPSVSSNFSVFEGKTCGNNSIMCYTILPVLYNKKNRNSYLRHECITYLYFYYKRNKNNMQEMHWPDDGRNI